MSFKDGALDVDMHEVVLWHVQRAFRRHLVLFSFPHRRDWTGPQPYWKEKIYMYNIHRRVTNIMLDMTNNFYRVKMNIPRKWMYVWNGPLLRTAQVVFDGITFRNFIPICKWSFVLYAGTCFLIIIEKQKGASILIDGYINQQLTALTKSWGAGLVDVLASIGPIYRELLILTMLPTFIYIAIKD